MNTDDFRYMWRGKQVGLLPQQEAAVLATVDKRGEGKDRALLLLHGFSSSPAVYRRLIPNITNYDAILCPTLPGHGESIAAFAAVKADEWVTAAEQACESLCKNYQRVDVLGLSLGGLLACHLSQRFSLNHVYLLAPAFAVQFNIPWALKLAHVLRFFGLKHLPNRAGNLKDPQASELAYRLLPIVTIIEILTYINSFQFIPPHCPTDVFLGSFDEVVNSQLIEKLFKDLPQANIHWLKESAHVLPLDNDVGKILECLRP